MDSNHLPIAAYKDVAARLERACRCRQTGFKPVGLPIIPRYIIYKYLYVRLFFIYDAVLFAILYLLTAQESVLPLANSSRISKISLSSKLELALPAALPFLSLI